jgi:hypothetical protein
VVRPPPDEDETPDEEEIPDEDETPDEEVPAGLPAPPPADEAPPDPPAPDEPPTERCGSEGVKCANSAPITAATPAESNPMRQVILLTLRRPSSRTRTAGEYWVRCTFKSRRQVSAAEPSRFWTG